MDSGVKSVDFVVVTFGLPGIMNSRDFSQDQNGI